MNTSIAEQLNELDILESEDRIDDHEYLVNMARDIADQFADKPYRVLRIIGSLAWTMAKNAEYLRNETMPSKKRYGQWLQKQNDGTEFHDEKVKRLIDQMENTIEEIAVSQRCAEELANVHDELGVMFEQEAEMEGRKFSWRPRSKAMQDANESSPVKTTANDDALAKLMAQGKAA